jgi:hypothetical protein
MSPLPPSEAKVVDPFGGAKPCLLRRDKEVPLRVNPEPLGLPSAMSSGRMELGPKASPGLQAGESKG